MEREEDLIAALAVHDAVLDVTGPVRAALSGACLSGETLARRGFDVLTLRLGDLRQATYVLELYAAALATAGSRSLPSYRDRIVRPLCWVVSQLAGDGPSFPDMNLDWSARLIRDRGEDGIDGRIRHAIRSCREIYIETLPRSLADLLSEAMRGYVPPPPRD